MKLLFLSTSFLFLTSCSNVSLLGDIESNDQDVLFNESLMRYSDRRLEAVEIKSSLGGVKECHIGDISKGLTKLKEQYNILKEDPEYWNHIGNCYFLDKNFEKAAFFYQISMETAKVKKIKYPAVYNNLGVLSTKKRQFSQAFAYFNKALDINSSLLTPKFNLSQIYIKFGQLDKAKRHLDGLLKRSRNDVDVLASLGIVHLFKKQPKKSVEYFEKIGKEYISREDIAAYFAMALYEFGDVNKALKVLKEQDNPKLDEVKQISKNLKTKILKEIERLEKIKKEQEANKKKKKA